MKGLQPDAVVRCGQECSGAGGAHLDGWLLDPVLVMSDPKEALPDVPSSVSRRSRFRELSTLSPLWAS
jgi:hypothetical protein